MSVPSVLTELVDDGWGAAAAVAVPPPPVVRQRGARAALKIRRCQPTEGAAFWRWDCAMCGEYGGGRHHRDAVSRAMRHCGEHPEHRSSLLPPVRCRERDRRLSVHPALFAVDDDPPPTPLSI